MTIKTIDEHAYEIVTEEGTFAVCKDTLAKFDATKHEHGVAACPSSICFNTSLTRSYICISLPERDSASKNAYSRLT